MFVIKLGLVFNLEKKKVFNVHIHVISLLIPCLVSLQFYQDIFCFLPVELLEICHMCINESSYALGDKRSPRLKRKCIRNDYRE